MSFLTPLFLIGALAIALPVVFHLVRRTTRTRTPFSSLMFLTPTPPRLTRRSRIEHWLLLCLRCLALALLTFAFARPFFRDHSAILPLASAPKDIVVLIDASASMRREPLWTFARAKAEAITRHASAVDRVAIMTFSRRTTPLVSFAEWTSAPPDARATLVADRLSASGPGWGGTHLGEALVAAADALTDLDDEKMAASTREIVLISDLQAGSRLDTLQSYEWPKGITLRVEPVAAQRAGNAGLQLAGAMSDAENAANRVVRVRVSNAADSKTEQFSIGWARGADNARIGGSLDAYVPPGQSRILALPVPAGSSGLERIELSGDSEPFDNTLFVAPPDQQRLRALYIGGEVAEDSKRPLYFLKRALPSTPSFTVDVVARRPDSAISQADLDDAAIIFLTEAPAGGSLDAVRAQALAGKTVVAAPSSAAAATAMGALFEGMNLGAEEAKLPRYAMWGEIDFKHPLFAAFADPRFGDFTKISVWKYRQLDAAKLTGSRVIARFDSGDPALIEAPLGKGKVLFFATGWNPEDSQLAVSSKFVPLVWSILELAGVARPAVSQFVVGDTPSLDKAAGFTHARLPNGRMLTLVAGAERLEDTSLPGIYHAVGPRGEQQFVVNVDASETRTEPLSLDELERLGVTMKAAANSDPAASARKEAPLHAVETESRQKLWRWFIGATLVILIFESILAGWTARRAVSDNLSPTRRVIP